MAPVHSRHSTEVVLVRHGETDSNQAGRVQGRKIDEELNQAGRKQAVQVAYHLSKEAKPAAIYSSVMKRAKQTSETIAAVCCVPHLVIDPNLTEMHMGELEGQYVADVKRSETYKALTDGDRDLEIPGSGESLNQLSERCVSRLNTIAQKHKGERVIVVSHEVVIREICKHADPTISDRRKFPNTSISIVDISSFEGRWILEKIGDVEHLTGDGFPQSASNL